MQAETNEQPPGSVIRQLGLSEKLPKVYQVWFVATWLLNITISPLLPPEFICCNLYSAKWEDFFDPSIQWPVRSAPSMSLFVADYLQDPRSSKVGIVFSPFDSNSQNYRISKQLDALSATMENLDPVASLLEGHRCRVALLDVRTLILSKLHCQTNWNPVYINPGHPQWGEGLRSD